MSKANNKVFHFWSVKKIGTADLAVIMGKKDWIEFIDSGRSVLGELNRPSNSVEGLFRNLGFKIDTSTINRAKNMGRLDLKHVKAIALLRACKNIEDYNINKDTHVEEWGDGIRTEYYSVLLEVEKKIKKFYMPLARRTKRQVKNIFPIDLCEDSKKNHALIRVIGRFMTRGNYDKLSIRYNVSNQNLVDAQEKDIKKVFGEGGKYANRLKCYLYSTLFRAQIETIVPNLIDNNPEREFPDLLLKLKKCFKEEFVRVVADNIAYIDSHEVWFWTERKHLLEGVSKMLKEFDVGHSGPKNKPNVYVDIRHIKPMILRYKKQFRDKRLQPFMSGLLPKENVINIFLEELEKKREHEPTDIVKELEISGIEDLNPSFVLSLLLKKWQLSEEGKLPSGIQERMELFEEVINELGIKNSSRLYDHKKVFVTKANKDHKVLGEKYTTDEKFRRRFDFAVLPFLLERAHTKKRLEYARFVIRIKAKIDLVNFRKIGFGIDTKNQKLDNLIESINRFLK